MWQSFAGRRRGLRNLRPAIRRGRSSARRRVRREHDDGGQPDVPERRDGAGRRVRRRLAEPRSGRRPGRHLREALRRLGQSPLERDPGQHVHDGPADPRERRHRGFGRIRRRLAERRAGRRRVGGLRAAFRRSRGPDHGRARVERVHDGGPEDAPRRGNGRRGLSRRLGGRRGRRLDNQTWARRFAADSTARDDAFRVNVFDSSNNQTNPAVASDPRGGFAVVWQSLVQDGDDFGIYARRGGFPGAVSVAVDERAAGSGTSDTNGRARDGGDRRGRSRLAERTRRESSTCRAGRTDFTGPAGPVYTLNDDTAGYGSIPAGGTDDCFTATGNCYEMRVTGARPGPHWDVTFVEDLPDPGRAEDLDAPRRRELPRCSARGPVLRIRRDDLPRWHHGGRLLRQATAPKTRPCGSRWRSSC